MHVNNSRPSIRKLIAILPSYYCRNKNQKHNYQKHIIILLRDNYVRLHNSYMKAQTLQNYRGVTARAIGTGALYARSVCPHRFLPQAASHALSSRFLALHCSCCSALSFSCVFCTRLSFCVSRVVASRDRSCVLRRSMLVAQ